MEQTVFGIHTGIFRHQITKKECIAVKAFFGLQPHETLSEEMFFFDRGITKIWIKEVHGRYSKNYIYVKINFLRALGTSSHKTMPYTILNAGKVIRAVDKILKTLPLLEKNSSFSDWAAERIDTAFDIYEEYPALLMWLLNHILNLGNRTKKCSRITIHAAGKTPGHVWRESMRFGNASYIYNIYAILQEVTARAGENGSTAAPEEIEEVQHLLRVERQNLANACKKLLPDGKAANLAEPGVRDKILKTMTDEAEKFFGRGDFYSWEGIKKKYFPEHKAEIDAVLAAMVQITKTSLEASQEAFTKEIADTLEQLGLAPAGIPPGKHSIDCVQNLYSRIVKTYPRPPDKRRYHSFPIPHRTGDGRYKATITLYQADGIRKQLSVAGRDMEGYEQKVWQKLSSVYLGNRKYVEQHSTANHDFYEKSADSICRFCKAAKTKEARENAEWFVKHFCLDDKNN